MSAPDTNIEKQKDRHWPSIVGICVALALGVVIGLLIAYIANVDGPQAGSSLSDRHTPTDIQSLHAA